MTSHSGGILGVCGRIRSGKDTAVDWFVEHCSAARTGYGDMLARVLGELAIPPTRKNLQDLSTLLRVPPGRHERPKGMAVLASLFDVSLAVANDAAPGYRARLREALRALHIDPSDENTDRFSDLVSHPDDPGLILPLGGFGEDVLAKGILSETRSIMARRGKVVMAGVRRFADIGLFRAREPAFKLLYIPAPLETRWWRAINDPAKPDEAKMTLEDYRERDNAETEREIEAVGATADFIVPNDGTKEEFFLRLRDVAEKMGWPIVG